MLLGPPTAFSIACSSEMTSLGEEGGREGGRGGGREGGRKGGRVAGRQGGREGGREGGRKERGMKKRDSSEDHYCIPELLSANTNGNT